MRTFSSPTHRAAHRRTHGTSRTASHQAIRTRGVTLVETAAVAVVLAVVATSSAPGLRELIESRRLAGAAAELVTDIALARSEAVARNQPVRLSLHAATGCYVVQTGLAAQCRCDATGPAVCSPGAVAIKTVRLPAGEGITLQANTASLLFDPMHGTATPTGTLRLLDSRGRAVHQIVNVMGRVRSCSPQPTLPGHRAC